MKQKKDAFYFSHDSNARQDPKLGAVRAKYGWAGYGLYWAIIEVLRDQPNYSYPISLLYGLPLAIGYDPNNPYGEDIPFDTFVEDLVSFGLLKKDENNLFSESLLTRMVALSAYREKLSESGKHGADIRWGGHRGANATPIAVKVSKVKESNTNLFDEFYSKYPKKQGKEDALKAFSKIDLKDGLFEVIMGAVGAWSASDAWIKDSGKYIPLPATWLRGRRWEDELPKGADPYASLRKISF